jgi:HEPN domain-containing protein
MKNGSSGRFTLHRPSQTGKKVPLKSFDDRSVKLELFELKATPSFSPIDFNIFAMTEILDWSLSDRLRFWHAAEELRQHGPASIFDIKPHMLVTRLDKEEDAFCHCTISMDGEITIWSNDSDYAEEFFSRLFVNVPPSFHGIEDWKITQKWLDAPQEIAIFTGSLNGTLSWTDQVAQAIDRSIDEAKASYDQKNWDACVVMCRRALEAIMRFAFQRFFQQEPKNLGFNDITRKFEKEKPDVIPEHLIRILDSVRDIGNVPGAHPQEIEGYKVTRLDADLALLNTVAFREAYFSKIDKDVGRVYTVRFDPVKQRQDTGRE